MPVKATLYKPGRVRGATPPTLHLSVWTKTFDAAATIVDASGGAHRRLVQRLKLTLAQLFGRHSLHHAAAANHVSWWSDTNTTRQTTRLDITHRVLSCWTGTAQPCQLSTQCLIWCECSLNLYRLMLLGRYALRAGYYSTESESLES